MSIDSDKIGRFSLALQNMMLKMEQVDNSCMEITKDLSKREFSTVAFIGKEQPVIMRDIAEYLNVPVSTTTGVIDKLVDSGYLKRFHSKKDRRIIEVELSKNGKHTFELLESILFEMCSKMLGDLHGNEPDQLISLLEKVSSNLTSHIPK